MAQRQTLLAPRFEGTVLAERSKIDDMINALTERRTVIDEMLETYQVTEATLNDEETQPTPQKTAHGKKRGTGPAERKTVGKDKKGALEKIRAFMLNANGRLLSKDEIKAGVKQMYGVDLPGSWEQMFYRKIRSGKVFYNENSRFGLLEHRANVETVARIPETVSA